MNGQLEIVWKEAVVGRVECQSVQQLSGARLELGLTTGPKVNLY